MSDPIRKAIAANPVADIMADELDGRCHSLVIVAVTDDGQVKSFVRRTGDEWDLMAASALDCARLALIKDCPGLSLIIEG